MITSKERLLKVINELPNNDLEKVLDFAESLAQSHAYWTKPNESSFDFWDDAIEHEIWNNI